MELRLLGRVARSEGAGWHPLEPTKAHLLLVYLADCSEWVERTRLAYLFWPDLPEDQARTNLRQRLRGLQRLPWLAGLEVEPQRLRWRVPTDTQRFRSAVARGDWQAAVAGYGGAFLDVQVPDGPYGEWALAERELLERAYEGAALRRAGELELAGAQAEAAALLQGVLRCNPLAEDALQAFMRTAARSGDRSAALTAFEEFSITLRRELGLEPLPETRGLASGLRESPPAAIAPNAVAARPRGGLPEVGLHGRAGAIEAVRAAPGPVVIVSGEPGVGKTALARRLAGGAVRLALQEGLQNLPYGALVEHLRRERNPGATPTAPLGAWAELLPEFGVGPLDAGMDADLTKARLFDAFARHFGARAPPGDAFALLLDDLQWADNPTLEWLAYLAATSRFRVLATFRQGEAGPALARLLDHLESSGRGVVVELEPLAELHTGALLAQLGGAPPAPRLRRELHAASGGNPFFLLQLLEALLETGALRRTADGDRLDLAALDALPRLPALPRKVAALVRRRVEHLGDAARRVLEAASVVRAGFDVALLAPLAGLSDVATAQALARAERAGIVHGDRFRHDLFREALYAALPSGHRRFLHRRIAEALPSDRALVAAEHWWWAGESRRALDHWVAGARVFNRQGLLHEAIEVLERAVVYAPEHDLPRGWLAHLYLHTARFAQARAAAEALATAGASAEAQLWGRGTLADLALRQGRSREALAHAEAGLPLLDAVPPADHPPGLRSVFATILTVNGEHERALARIHLNRRVASDALEAAYADLAEGFALLHVPDHERSYACFASALRTARALGARQLEVHLAACMASLVGYAGTPAEILALGERALTLGEYQYTPLLRSHLSEAYLRQGDARRALALARRVTDAPADLNFLGLAWAQRAEAHARLGEDPSAAVEAALEHFARIDFPNTRAKILAVALQRGTPAQRARALQLVPSVRLERAMPHFREAFQRVWEAVRGASR